MFGALWTYLLAGAIGGFVYAILDHLDNRR